MSDNKIEVHKQTAPTGVTPDLLKYIAAYGERVTTAEVGYTLGVHPGVVIIDGVPRMAMWRTSSSNPGVFFYTLTEPGVSASGSIERVIPFNPMVTTDTMKDHENRTRVMALDIAAPGIYHHGGSSMQQGSTLPVRLGGHHTNTATAREWVFVDGAAPLGPFRGLSTQPTTEQPTTEQPRVDGLTAEQWKRKWDALWEALGQEAERRDWCSEYDEFASDNGGPERSMEWEVTALVSGTMSNTGGLDSAIAAHITQPSHGRMYLDMQSSVEIEFRTSLTLKHIGTPDEVAVARHLREHVVDGSEFEIDNVEIESVEQA